MRPLSFVFLLLLLVGSSGAAPRIARGGQDFPESWSPDGRRIVFARTAMGVGRCTAFQIKPDGRGLRRMPGCGAGYVWAPDGQTVAFARGRLEYKGFVAGGIFVMAARGGPVRRLTRAVEFTDAAPVWSPDGAWIAFTRTRYRKLGPGRFRQVGTNVWLVRPDGSRAHRVGRRAGSDWGASWSPDGRQIVFVRESGRRQNDLFIADVSKGTVRRLTYGADNGYPKWSPTAGLIVFQRARDLARDSDVDLWSVRSDGTGLRQLAPTENGMSTVWAPNGKLIAFQGRGGCGRKPPSEVTLEICLMRPDGRGLRPLFPSFEADEIPYDQSPVWSPDSKRLVFARFDLDRTGISLYIADVDGRRAFPLTGVGAGPPAPQPSIRALVARAGSAGFACGRFRQVRVTSSLAREEGRCRAYAVTTFRTSRLRAAWVSARRNEPWFAARYVIVGRTWAVWTWRTDLALGLQDALQGDLLRVSLRPPNPTIRWRPCDAKPPGGDCPSPLPARPIPRSPSGPVYSFASDFWDTDVTMAWGGLYVVSESAPGTTALTGVVSDGRRTRVPFDPPVAGVTVTLQSVDAPGLPVLSVQLTTVTDRQGGFAFIDVPALSPATCYRTSVSDPRLPSFSYVGPMQPGEQYEQDVELEPGGVDDGESLCYAGPTSLSS